MNLTFHDLGRSCPAPGCNWYGIARLIFNRKKPGNDNFVALDFDIPRTTDGEALLTARTLLDYEWLTCSLVTHFEWKIEDERRTGITTHENFIPDGLIDLCENSYNVRYNKLRDLLEIEIVEEEESDDNTLTEDEEEGAGPDDEEAGAGPDDEEYEDEEE